MSAPAGYTQLSAQTPEQQGGLQQLLSLIGGQGAEGFQQALQTLMGIISGSDESFQDIEAPIMRQFNEQIIPGLQERLTAQGVGGRSATQGRMLGEAGEKLSEGLASQRSGMRQSAIQQLLDTYLKGQGLGLGTQPFAGVQEEAPSMWNRFGKGLGGAGSGALAGATVGSIVPGLGTATGAVLGGLGGAFKSYFS